MLALLSWPIVAGTFWVWANIATIGNRNRSLIAVAVALLIHSLVTFCNSSFFTGMIFAF